MQKARRRLSAPTACRRTVSGSLSLPCSGFFPPFPHGTGSLSVFRSCLALRDGPRRFGQDSSCPALLRWRPRRSPVTRTGLSPSADRLSRRFRFLGARHLRPPTTPAAPRRRRFGLLPFRSPLLRESIFLSFPAGTKMFQFPAFAPDLSPARGLQPRGFPHSDTHGSLPVCGSPCIFAAYRVLPRFRKPRHPPFALLLFLSSRVLLRITLFSLAYSSCSLKLLPSDVGAPPGARHRLYHFFTSFSLSIVNELCFVVPSLKGMQRYTLFL